MGEIGQPKRKRGRIRKEEPKAAGEKKEETRKSRTTGGWRLT